MRKSNTIKWMVAFSFVVVVSFGFLHSEKAKQDSANKPATEKPKSIKKVTKSDSEWKKSLTPEQYRILRKAGTERAHGEVYHEFKKQGAGTYFCAGCDSELFSSNEKNLIQDVVGRLSSILLRLKTLKPRLIIFWVTQELKFCVRFAMDI